jgi:hypothetical protein
LNINFGIKNKRQDCKISTVWGGTCGRGRENGGDEGKEIRLIVFIYIYKIRMMKCFAIALRGIGRVWGR